MRAEASVLVGAYLKCEDLARARASFSELSRLAETAGARVAQTLTQRVDRFHPRTLIGKGKIVEVSRAASLAQARTVIFDCDLTPVQQKELEKALAAKVIDRTRLILDIFAQRARTKEGELQVELAQLSYMLPRLTGSWRGFSQQFGGIGTRGPGERKLEYERRHIQRRIQHLKGDIEDIRRSRSVQRRKRLTVPVPSVAIIGYTNVGKSSLLNRLMEEGARSPIYADDKLFATLDPTSRRVRMPQGGWAVFTDTVGFISRLPTTLVAAFRSTLEEVLEADCLLLVEDCSAPDLEEQRRTVASVLDDLGAGRIPCVAVLNKADLLSTGQRKPLEGDGARPLVSALTGEGTGAMLSRVQEVLNSRWLLRELSVDAADGRFIGEIHRNSQVVSRKTAGDRLVLSLRVTQENWRRILRLMNPGG